MAKRYNHDAGETTQNERAGNMPDKIEEALKQETDKQRAEKFDLSKIDVAELKKKTKEVLLEIADSKDIPASDNNQRTHLRECAAQIEKLIDNYQPKPGTPDHDLFIQLETPVMPIGTSETEKEAKAAEMKKERDEIWFAYRGHLQRQVGLVLKIASMEEFSDTREGREILIGIMRSLDTKGSDATIEGFDKAFRERVKVETPEDEDKLLALKGAIKTLGAASPVPFKDFHKARFENKHTDAERKAEIEEIERQDVERQREMIRMVKVLLPEEERKSALWERSHERPQLPASTVSAEDNRVADTFMDTWIEDVEVKGGVKIYAEQGNQFVAKKKFLGVVEYSATNQVKDTVKMVKSAVWRQRDDGKIAEENIEVAFIDLFTDAPLSFVTRGPELGRAHRRGSDPIQHIKVYHQELNDIVQAEELRRLWNIPPARRNTDGTITMPFHDEDIDGKPRPGIFNCSEARYLKYMEAIQQTIKNFEKLGFTYDEQKNLQDKKKAVYERRWGGVYEPRPTSSTETEFVRSYMEEELDRAIADIERENNPETRHLANKMRQARARVNDIATEHCINYGHMDKYQKLAAQRLANRGITEGNTRWQELLEKELTFVIDYYRAQDISLKNMGTNMLEMSDMAYAIAPDRNTARENRMKYYAQLINLDYQIERNTIERAATDSSDVRELLDIPEREDISMQRLVEIRVNQAFLPILRDSQTRESHFQDLDKKKTEAKEVLEAASLFMRGKMLSLLNTELEERVASISVQNVIPADAAQLGIDVAALETQAAEQIQQIRDAHEAFLDRLRFAVTNLERRSTQHIEQEPRQLVNPDEINFDVRLLDLVRATRTTTQEERDLLWENAEIYAIPRVTSQIENTVGLLNTTLEMNKPDTDGQLHMTERVQAFVDRFGPVPQPPRPLPPRAIPRPPARNGRRRP